MISMIDILFGKHWRSISDAFDGMLAAAKVDKECCHIPETECPPRCVERISWKLGRGVTPTASIVVRNVGRVGRQFTFAGSPLSGLDLGQAKLSVEPAAVFIEAGKAERVGVKLEHSADLVAGHEYKAEFTFVGSWERCVPIDVVVTPDAFERCSLSQRDTPPNLHAVKASHHHDSAVAIAWKVQRGEVPRAQLVVRNQGSASRRFEFSASALTGLDSSKATLTVVPSAKDLGAGQEVIVELRMDGTAHLHPRQQYEAFLVVAGFYEQRVPIRCEVERDPAVVVQVAQGEFPTRIRAHHWYDHFQCTVPCSDAVGPDAPER